LVIKINERISAFSEKTLKPEITIRSKRWFLPWEKHLNRRESRISIVNITRFKICYIPVEQFFLLIWIFLFLFTNLFFRKTLQTRLQLQDTNRILATRFCTKRVPLFNRRLLFHWIKYAISKALKYLSQPRVKSKNKPKRHQVFSRFGGNDYDWKLEQ